MKISYNWLTWYIDPLPNAEELAEKIIFGAFEVEEKITVGDDTIFDIKVLPDRAHDCLSHRGIAREVAGLLGARFIDPTEKFVVPPSVPTELTVNIETPLCRRYMARVIRNVKVGPSPDWVVKHLESIGQRSINNIVDATNLVMFDCGQPTHAFDVNKLTSSNISITTVAEPVSCTTLSGEVKELQSGEMVIMSKAKGEGDNKNDVVLAIAGVKGGNHAEVDAQTTDIMIEVANFDPVAVRKTARRLNLLTDSAKRFENELTPELAAYAMRELSATILEMCPDATFEEIIDIYPHPIEQRSVSLSTDYLNARLGAEMSVITITEILKNYNYEFAEESGNFTIAIPFERIDITGPHDMIEEIGRAYGYNNITACLPVLGTTPEGKPISPVLNDTFAKVCAIKTDLIAKGYHEVMNYSFRKKGDYEVARGPVGKSALRTNLSDGLEDSFQMNRLNKDFLEIDDMKIFEVGTVFSLGAPEAFHVALRDKNGIQEMTLDTYLETFQVTLPSEQYAYGDHTQDIHHMFMSWSEYPAMTRDIAVWTPGEVSGGEVRDLIREHAGNLLVKGPRLFDTFSKEGRTSYAFRLVFQSPERTLVEDEVNRDMANITQALQGQGWEIR